MILRLFRIELEPADPLQFSLPEFRYALTTQMAASLPPSFPDHPAEQYIHRYPALQCKQVKSQLLVIGICQGAGFLFRLTEGEREILAGKNHCAIRYRDPGIREEEFGVADREREFEFLTPYLALNQQYAKKFYDLKGKPARDAFMQKILDTHLKTLAKSLDYTPDHPVTCTAHLRFIRERIDHENRIVFLGKFRTNLRIPDYLGIGQSVSQGFGTVRGYSDQMPAESPRDSLHGSSD